MKTTKKKYKILNAPTAELLSSKVLEKMEEGYVPVGSHTVVVREVQNVFSGLSHRRSISTIEYAQTIMLRKFT